MSSDSEDLFFDAESNVSLDNFQAGDASNRPDDIHSMNLNRDSSMKNRKVEDILCCIQLREEENDKEFQSPDKTKFVKTDSVSLHSIESLTRTGLILKSDNSDAMNINCNRMSSDEKISHVECQRPVASRRNFPIVAKIGSKIIPNLNHNEEKVTQFSEKISVSKKIELNEPGIADDMKSPVHAYAAPIMPVPPPRKRKNVKASHTVSQEGFRSKNVLLANDESKTTVVAQVTSRKYSMTHSISSGKSPPNDLKAGKLQSSLLITRNKTANEPRNRDAKSENNEYNPREDKKPKNSHPIFLHLRKVASEAGNSSKEHSSLDLDERTMGIQNVYAKTRDNITLRKKALNGIHATTASTVKKTIQKAVKKTIQKAKKTVKGIVSEDVEMHLPYEANMKGKFYKMLPSSSNKGPFEFDNVQCIQELSGGHKGPVWCMKFSKCGRLLATAGKDKILLIWVVKSAFNCFLDMRNEKNASNKDASTPSSETIIFPQSLEGSWTRSSSLSGNPEISTASSSGPFMSKPFCVYSGHTGDIMDLSWSINHFILSMSMDKTVRLWHISQNECLGCFRHNDLVTAIAFNPMDDRYFLSCTLDGKLRLWNILDKKVEHCNEIDGQVKLISAANFTQNGEFAIIGSHNGRCIFYSVKDLKYHTQIHVKGKKSVENTLVTGIEPIPGGNKILVTTNDSLLRLYDLRDFSPSYKYMGCVNNNSRTRASLSHDGNYIVCGSENQCLYMWKTFHSVPKFFSARQHRNDSWEAIRAHNASITSAIFATNPQIIIDCVEHNQNKNQVRPKITEQSCSQNTAQINGSNRASLSAGLTGYVIVSSDDNSTIKVLMNKTKRNNASLPDTTSSKIIIRSLNWSERPGTLKARLGVITAALSSSTFSLRMKNLYHASNKLLSKAHSIGPK
ncbi:WD repeat-containing protein 44-like [Artemia franciscana]|uniref:WD repeat-containing protein 44-like n=1 Tax=Artemia franciscana TaxID=6661 RepID=UPI0032DB8D70